MRSMNFLRAKKRKGFTLVELLIVVLVIITVLAIVAFVVNPLEFIRQSRDSTRISGLSTLSRSIDLYYSDAINTGASFSLGTSSLVYISIPDPTATSTAGDQCQGLGLLTLPAGYTYQCAASSTYKNTDGTGWIPINFGAFSGGTNLLATLPIDPTNTTSSGLYYTYTLASGNQYALTALSESKKEKAALSLQPMSLNFPGIIAYGSNIGAAALYNTSGLVGYWPLDEGTGSSTADQSGNGNTGTWNGASVGTNGHYSVSKVGSWGGVFDGTSTYVVKVSPNSFPTIQGVMTLALWVNYPTAASRAIALSLAKDDTNGAGNSVDVELFGTSTIGVTGWGGPPLYTLASSTAPSINTWHFIAYTQTGGGVNLYIDGALVGTGSNPTNIGSVGVMRIGSFNSGFPSPFWKGSIDDVRIYNRALSAAEIQALYNAQK